MFNNYFNKPNNNQEESMNIVSIIKSKIQKAYLFRCQQAVTIHEAAHIICGLDYAKASFSVQCLSVLVSAKPGGNGFATSAEGISMAQTIVGCMVGSIAGHKFAGIPWVWEETEEGWGDRTLVEIVYRKRLPEGGTDAEIEELKREAVAYVEENWPRILKMADYIEQHSKPKVISEEERAENAFMNGDYLEAVIPPNWEFYYRPKKNLLAPLAALVIGLGLLGGCVGLNNYQETVDIEYTA